MRDKKKKNTTIQIPRKVFGYEDHLFGNHWSTIIRVVQVRVEKSTYIEPVRDIVSHVVVCRAEIDCFRHFGLFAFFFSHFFLLFFRVLFRHSCERVAPPSLPRWSIHEISQFGTYAKINQPRPPPLPEIEFGLDPNNNTCFI